ncbi:MAG TPA: helix-turn-helix domain-containing protein [Candidatus Paceibacterota bacterium]
MSEEARLMIVARRLQGMSIPEISRETGMAKTTIQRYVKHVPISQEARRLLREKQGGGKERALGLRENSLERAKGLIGEINTRDTLFLLIGLYWGEGTKKDFSVINSDPNLLVAFLGCLDDMGIPRERISLSLRLHADISEPHACQFWSRTLNVPASRINRVEIIKGKKKGKLQYGMCRIRVRSGIRERLVIQSAIQLIGKEASKRVLSA